jgi:hypothetical protein
MPGNRKWELRRIEDETNDTTKIKMTNDGYLQAQQTDPFRKRKLTKNPNLSPPFCVSLLTLAGSRTKVVASLSCNLTSHFCLPSMMIIRKWEMNASR